MKYKKRNHEKNKTLDLLFTSSLRMDTYGWELGVNVSEQQKNKKKNRLTKQFAKRHPDNRNGPMLKLDISLTCPPVSKKRLSSLP